jgi:hypothetical protein
MNLVKNLIRTVDGNSCRRYSATPAEMSIAHARGKIFDNSEKV